MASTSLPTTDTRPEESHNIPHAPTTGSVEMSNLQSQSIPPSQLPAAESMPAPAPSAPLSSGAQTVTTTSQLPSQPTETSADISTMPPTTSDATAQQPALTRQQTEAIGPSTDSPTPVAVANTNAVHINLLLTNGARHPYTVDERYLKKRGVTPEGMDPFHLSVYNLKELILRDWRSGRRIHNHAWEGVVTDVQYRMGSSTRSTRVDTTDPLRTDARR